MPFTVKAVTRLHFAPPSETPVITETNSHELAVKVAGKLFEKLSEKTGSTESVQQGKADIKGLVRAVLGIGDGMALDVRGQAESGPEWPKEWHDLPEQVQQSERLLIAQLLYITDMGPNAFGTTHTLNPQAFCAFLRDALGEKVSAALQVPMAPITEHAAQKYLQRQPDIRYERALIDGLGVSLTGATHQLQLDVPVQPSPIPSEVALHASPHDASHAGSDALVGALHNALLNNDYEGVRGLLAACCRLAPANVPEALEPMLPHALSLVIEENDLALFMALESAQFIDHTTVLHDSASGESSDLLRYAMARGAEDITIHLLEQAVAQGVSRDAALSRLQRFVLAGAFQQGIPLSHEMLDIALEKSALVDKIAVLVDAAGQDVWLCTRLLNHLEKNLDGLRDALMPWKDKRFGDWPLLQIFKKEQVGEEIIGLLRSSGLESTDIPFLHLACRAANPTLVGLLAKDDPDPLYLPAWSGMTALHHLMQTYEDDSVTDAVDESQVMKCLTALLTRVGQCGADGGTVSAWINALPGTHLLERWNLDHEALPVLHMAIGCGWNEVHDLLASHGADLFSRGCDGSSVMHAAGSAMIDKLMALPAAARPDIDAVDHAGRTPLYNAITQYNNQRMARKWIEHGASVLVRNHDGDTCFEALLRHMPALVDRFKAHPKFRAAVTATITEKNGDVTTLFHRICARASDQAIIQMIELGADVNKKVGWSQLTPLHVHISHTKSPLKYTERGEEPYRALKRLLSKKSDVNAQNVSGYSAFHMAVIQNNPMVVAELLKSGRVDLSRLVTSTHDNCLHLAVQSRNAHTVKMLVEIASIAAVAPAALYAHRNLRGKTPLDMARSFKRNTIAELLVEAYQKAGVSTDYVITPQVSSIGKRGRMDDSDGDSDDGVSRTKGRRLGT